VNFGTLTQTADGKFWSWTGKEIPASQVTMGRHPNGGPVKAWQTYTEKQLQVVEDVSKLIVQTYKLIDVLGHETVSPGRKSDPGFAFHLDNFRARLFGRHQ
jgi:N-acetylmuramoyl-L-alanine amidase